MVYTERWIEMPHLGVRYDHFEFRSLDEPARPHPLSRTGYLSHFADTATVEHYGGAEGYVTAFAEAQLNRRTVTTPPEAPEDEEPSPPVAEKPRQLSLF